MRFKHMAAIVAAFLLVALAQPAKANYEMGLTQFCGDRYCSTQIAPIGKVHRHHASRGRHHHNRDGVRPPARITGGGIIRSKKTGRTAHVDPQYQSRFQALLDDFENHGATVYYMGGWRPGHCSLRHQHSCSWAVDFCQDYRGHVSGARDCNLPRPAEFHALVRKHGLYDGSVWCNGDYGHVQVKDSGGCNIAAHGSWGRGHYLASITGTVRLSAKRHHHHHQRYARR